MIRNRLLALSTSYPLRDDSSTGIFVARLYRALPDTWSVHVICPGDTGAQSVASGGDGRVSVCAVAYAPRAWRVVAQKSGGVAPGIRRAPWRVLLLPLLFAALAWRTLLGARNADLIHANWAICGAIAAPLASWMRRPLVTTLRGDDVMRARKSRLDRWLLHRAVNGSRRIICVSAAMADELRGWYPLRADDIKACLNGVAAEFAGASRLRHPSPRLRIVGVGSLIPRKGFDVLLRALAQLPMGTDWELRVAGEGPERERLALLIDELGITDRVELTGALAPDAMPLFLGNADLFVLASHSEGRPNALIEAVAAGLPAISTALPGVVGLVEPGVSGWLVGIGDTESLRDALKQACNDRAELARRASETRLRLSHSCHDWAETGRCYDATFRAALADRRETSN